MGSSWPTMPLTASSVRPRLASSICPVGDTTYGLSPACITRASPSTLTIACSREGTRLIYSRVCTRAQWTRFGCTPLQMSARAAAAYRGGPVCPPEAGTLSAALLPPRSADLVDADELDDLVPARLVRRHDPLRPQVLQHAPVAVIGRADIGDGSQRR